VDMKKMWYTGPGARPCKTEWISGVVYQCREGDYWRARMAELRSQDPDQAVQDSKDIGWGHS
jgi:hypothetical protein